MPVLAGHELGLGVGVDGDDLRMALDAGNGRVDGQFAEQAPEGLVRVVVHLLVAEEEDLVAGQRLAQLGRLPVGERLAQVDAEHLGADAPGHGLHVEDFVSHGLSSYWPRKRPWQ